MRKVILVAAAFCLLLLVPAATAKSVNVDLSKLGFVPSAAAVQVGDTVIWTNKNKKGTVTVKAVPAALTLSATPATVTYGASTNSSGTLSTQQAGQKVEILAQECSQNN